MAKGVRFTAPFSVEIGEEVALERIAGQGVVIYGGARLYGADTLVSPETIIGAEGPVTMVNCQLGPRVELKGGFFESSVFLEKASMASGAQVREGTLLEEGAKVGHTVGLKQTILFPYVTLGSLINFCDCLMAGGTGKEDHSEVGSSYIHFNYTPQQDKATPSLIGDVPRGVMLDQPPIFLGGQGGLVGPLRLDYGTVITAGTVWRHDSSGAKLLHGGAGRPLRHDYQAGLYGDISRKVNHNIVYIANLRALREWYAHVRRPFFEKEEMGAPLWGGSLALLDRALEERLKRFREFSGLLRKSATIGEEREGPVSGIFRRQRELTERWPEIEAALQASLESGSLLQSREAFLEPFLKRAREADNYLAAIRALDEKAKRAGIFWLQQVVDTVAGRVLNLLPAFRSYTT